MSMVTNILLCTMIDEEEAIAAVNVSFKSGMPFTDLESSPMPYYAGSVCVECGIYVGAFNYLNDADLIKAIEAAPWKFPEDVQLFIKRQDDDRFAEVTLTLAPQRVDNIVDKYGKLE
jgi:hypothetical protein